MEKVIEFADFLKQDYEIVEAQRENDDELKLYWQLAGTSQNYTSEELYNEWRQSQTLDIQYDTHPPMGGIATPATEWQLCPKCNGQGIVSLPPFVAGDNMYWSGSTVETYQCGLCNGAKVILRPTVQQPKEVEQNEWIWTDELILAYARYYRFSSSRTSIEQWKEMYLRNNEPPTKQKQ